MKKMSDDPVCFVARLEEVRKYGLCPLGQLKRNPEAKLSFPRKIKEVKNNVIKGNS